MAKKLLGQLKLQIPAGSANPSPPVGPALGQRGINIMPIPVVIDYYQDKSFTFVTKTPPASVLLKKAAGLKIGKPNSGAKQPGKDVAGKVTEAQCREIAEAKMVDLNANDLDAATEIIKGSARSMGLNVVG